MKKFHKISPLIFLVLLTSCGLIERFKTPTEPTSSEAQTETATVEADANEDSFFAEAFNDAKTEESTSELNDLSTDAPSNIIVDNANEAATQVASDVQQDLNALEKDMPIQIKEEPKAIAQSQLSEAGTLTSEINTYTVQKGETLMQIAFKLYGDLSKWKSLKELNQSNLSGGTLKRGSKIKYYVPETPFAWNPQGTPYLIKSGETLGTISNSVYQTPKKWKKIWENNRPLIKNPDRIYAGFTLYYLNDGLADNSIESSRENYVEKTPVDSMAEKEMAEVQARIENSTATVDVPATATASEESINRAVSASETTLNGLSEEDQILTVAPTNTATNTTVNEDELMNEIETLNAKELTATDSATLSEIEELANLKEEVSNTQSSIKK